jgi:hypothetical protein
LRPSSRATILIAALAICAYGALLRLHALTDRYGTLERPAWARVLTTNVAPLARHIEPAVYAWRRVAVPYVGGDPGSYLKFAREMRSFYQGHVREPMFLAITRGWIWLLGNQDIGISFASASMSTLAIFATFLLGRAAFSPAVGLAAALALAIDFDAVSWAPDGWRDDTFTCFVALGAWALVRLRQQPTVPRAVTAGVIGAAACLTRITSVSWLLPGLAIACVDRRAGEWRPRARAAGLAAVVTAILVAPYLVNCARVFGDPLISIDVHTGYYRAGEGIAPEKPMSAASYIGGKLARRPIAQIDTAATGIFVLPMRNKWSGFDAWVPHLAAILSGLAVLGLVSWLAVPDGRVLLVICLTSLVPYAFTWNIGDGRAWRFTAHAYPLFLVAAFSAIDLTWRAARAVRDGKARIDGRRLALAGGVVAACALAAAAYDRLPYYVAREALADGEETTLGAGERDDPFFTRDWSPPAGSGNVIFRVVVGDRARMTIPLPEGRAYRLTLRVDPVTAAAPRDLTVLVGGRMVARLGLALDPQRFGSYDVDVPVDLARGAVKLDLVAGGTVPASVCGDSCQALPASTPVSLRVWYVRIHPV